ISTVSRTNATVSHTAGTISTTIVSAVVNAAAKPGRHFLASRACTGYVTTARTAAHPSGMKNGLTMRNTSHARTARPPQGRTDATSSPRFLAFTGEAYA